MGQPTLVNTVVSEPIVKVQGFSKSYRKKLAVDGVDLAINKGEIYGLIGPDGAGKSTLMKAIAGVLTYDGGQVEVFGEIIDSEAAAEKIKGRIGFMPQGLGQNLYAELSVEENIDFFAQLREVSREQLISRKRKLLAMTRLDKFTNRPMKLLSGGMKQKLGLVCTLIHEPELIILDEPTTGVDPVSRRDFWAILTALLREQNIAALVSTAYMDEATRFQQLSLMYDGKVIAEGEPDQIIAKVPGTLVELIARPQAVALSQLKSIFQQVEAVGAVLRVFVEGQEEEAAIKQVKSLLSGQEVSEIHASQAEMEDAFIALLSQANLTDSETAPSIDTNQASEIDASQKDKLAIEAENLCRDFGDFRAVDQVSFQVRYGEIFGLLGANGAGKSTVFKMLTGILQPTGGEGKVAGQDMLRANQAIKERIGYMSQAFSLYQDMTVLENIRLYARIYAVARKELKQRVDWVIATAGLQGVENRLAGALPMGIRQRLALGCALVHQPKVLFLDEPTSGVDPVGRRRFWDILIQMARVEQVAILVTTHYMSEAEHCDHLALMYAGRIIADATPEQMKEALVKAAGELLEVTTDQPLLALKLIEQAGFEEAALFGKKIHLLAKEPQLVRQQIESIFTENNITLHSISHRHPSLEDVFVYQVMTHENEMARHEY
ncbi:MAG: ABC transporter [Cycloclasticus sp. Phe_18]|nr:MAG: ABC transporter [Cycloclasticus sp. Phe_18]MDF1690325.1 ATP-binding cassette domain-containing protein [Cycloclasticus sp.]